MTGRGGGGGNKSVLCPVFEMGGGGGGVNKSVLCPVFEMAVTLSSAGCPALDTLSAVSTLVQFTRSSKN